MSVLVTGGAGYIGSHVARLLGTDAIIVDDFSAGLESRVQGLICEHLDIASADASSRLESLMRKHEVTAVIHLAARKKVGESVEQPEWYYSQNIGGMANLLAAMRSAGVNKLVFSSSAATYGMPDVDLVNEDLNCSPINPYGETKLVGEWMAQDAAKAWGLRHVNLRYFNVAGAGWPELADTAVANLIPIVFAALKAGEKPKVFGGDYPTPDGSCIRDYVHVLDLAKAHVAALDYLDSDARPHATFNVGSGAGSSVFEVMDVIREVTGQNFEAEVLPGRAGDPPRLCADVSRIEKTLGWRTEADLTEIVRSAWQAIS
ncbi:MAG: UDP-glucose 4-epimerase GalE [Rhodoluna sp.]|nr:UDP-glucose 4-epimerase GalE [Rhodoluna sp.]